VGTVRSVRFMLRPSWLALTAAVVLFAVACFTLLAPWQFRRDDERQARNDAVAESFHSPPVPLEQLLPDPTAEPPDLHEWRQVTLTGSYLADAEAVARLRTVQGEPAFEVLTPFRLSSGTVVLVDRGFVRPARGNPGGGPGNGRGNQVPDYAEPPAGEVTVTGRLRRDEVDSERREAFDEGGHRQVYAVDSATVGRAAGLTIRPGYVQLNSGQPGVLGALPLPRLDAGPHLSYALQWLAFGVMALIGWFLLMRREAAERAGSATPAVVARTPATTGADQRGERG
jgi:cytochrome oxidase assembly protein ShyY1